jgi:hypothetical protein
MLGLINMAKNKQLRARVEDDIYTRVENKTEKISDFVREAVIEKLEREEYGNQSAVAVEKRQLELLLESRQTIINQYRDLIDKEEAECERIQAQIDEKNRILEARVERENNVKNNPKFREEFENATKFLLRKKYLQIDGNIEKVMNSKAQNLQYRRVSEFKEDLSNYIKKEWTIGRTFNVDGSNKEIVQADIEFMLNRLK